MLKWHLLNLLIDFNFMDDIFWMKRALLLANKALFYNQMPIGATLVRNNFELAFAINSYFMHAEINLINKACFYFNQKVFSDSTLYVTLKPCFECMSIIFNYKICNLVFGVYSDFMTFKNFNKINIKGGFLNEDSLLLLKSFFYR